MIAAEERTGFELARALDTEKLAAIFRETGRVRIAGLLADPEPLAAHVEAREDWRQVINSGDKVFELDRPSRRAMPAETLAALDTAVHAAARTGFQFRYETIRVPDAAAERAAIADPLNRFAAWMSTGAMRAALRAITGAPAIDFADAQATRYSPGDLLTGHDDRVAGKARHAAYVFGMTRRWRLEWGGLLIFHDGTDGFSGHVPGFNTLDLFRVPLTHSVSMVTPAADAPRHAITGWLRARV